MQRTELVLQAAGSDLRLCFSRESEWKGADGAAEESRWPWARSQLQSTSHLGKCSTEPGTWLAGPISALTIAPPCRAHSPILVCRSLPRLVFPSPKKYDAAQRRALKSR